MTFPAWVKIGLFLLSWVVLWLPVVVPLAKKLHWQPFQPITAAQKLPLLASLYAIAPLAIGLTVAAEGATFNTYGISWQSSLGMSSLKGLGLAIVGLGILWGIEGALGAITWHGEHISRLVRLSLPLLVLALWISLTEELIFRGIFFNQLQQDYPLWVAATVSSAIFALLHLVWERQETFAQLPGLWLMGMVLVEAKLVDGGSLGLAWGLHAGWVWGLASVEAAGLISYTEKGKDWIIGLKKQPLAGLAGILCLLGTGWVLIVNSYQSLSTSPS